MKKTEHLSSASCGRCYNGNPSSAAPRGTWQRTSGFFDILHESKFTCENLHARCHSCKSQCLFFFERESGVGSALEVLIIDLVYSGSLVCGLVCAVSTLYTTTAAYYIVHIRRLGTCNVTLKFQPLGSLVYYLIVGV